MDQGRCVKETRVRSGAGTQKRVLVSEDLLNYLSAFSSSHGPACVSRDVGRMERVQSREKIKVCMYLLVVVLFCMLLGWMC